jgi:hypothetical protein
MLFDNKERCGRYRANHPERTKANSRRWREKTFKAFLIKVSKYFPSLACVFCGQKDERAFIGISYHEINGKSHEYHNILKRFQYILDHPKDFAPICNKHHKKVHWLMKKGLTWEGIIVIWSENKNAF